MYLTTPSEQLYYLDLETDGLSPTLIHCCVIKNKATGQVWEFTQEGDLCIEHDLKDFINDKLKAGAYFCAHNGVSFDFPVLTRLASVVIPLDRQIDSLVLSYLYNPALVGGHSLEAYGVRLNFPKLEHSDWSVFTPEMLERCRQDVNLLEKVTDALCSKMLKIGFSELSCEIEHFTKHIIDKQTSHGFYFDVARATELRDFLRQRESNLAEGIHVLFPPKLEELGTYIRRKRQDGSDFASYEKHLKTYPEIRDNKDGTYTCLDYFPFNLASPAQRLDRLLSIGFEPVEFTKKGNPRVDEESLLKFAGSCGRPEVKALAEWLVCNGRANMIDTWLNNVGPDSRIHGKVLSCAATTRRMVHSAPNCVPLYSQALTRNGWKSYAELSIGEDILAYDLKTQTKKWTSLLAISVFAEAEVYSFGQQHVGKRLFCTKNHSWVVRDRDCKGYKNTEKLVEAQYLKHNRPVKINAPFDNDVVQSNFNLIQKKYDHDWTSEICKMSSAELNSMMQGFLLADGCRHGKTWSFAQAEGPLLDAFLTCFYLVSDTRISGCQKRKLKGPNQRMGYNIVQTTNTYMRTKDMALRYEGVESVWCPTTEFGTWVMKQGDFITITGNTANIPSPAKAAYGKECRSLWSTEPCRGLKLVGVDAGSLETVGLLHYLNRPEAVEVLTRPKPDDVHSANARALTKALGREIDREWGSKTCWYAYLYGAFSKKLGQIVKGPPSDGEIVVDVFVTSVPGLKQLNKKIENEWKKNGGLLKTIDGGFVRCPSLNAALNYKIQSLGAVVMKLAAMLLDRRAKEEGIWFQTVATVHDEWQMETSEEQAEALGKLAVACITEAAEQLKFKVPLGGAYKVGDSWSETH